MIENINIFFKEIHPIFQGVIGSALFAIFLWLIKYLFVKITNSIRTIRKKRDIEDIKRYIIFENYTNSDGLLYFSQGYFLILYNSTKNLILALIIILFNSIIQNVLPFFLTDIIFKGIAIYILVDVYGWYKPKLRKGNLSNYDPELVNYVKNKLLDDRLKKRVLKKEINLKETGFEELQAELNTLKNQLTGNNESEYENERKSKNNSL